MTHSDAAESSRSFDLIDQPWVLVQRLDGSVVEVSLLEALTSAHRLRGVVGELPTQAFALIRLLLAILHRSLGGPSDAWAWEALWRSVSIPADVEEYLRHFQDRFDLLHPATPFFQVADLRTERGEVFSLDRLIADAPVGEPYFTTRLHRGLDRISFGEAARWLVHCQAFDPSGIKSGAVGDDRVRNGKGYPIGTGWAGGLGGVLAEGRNLKETLLLNLVAADTEYLQIDERDRPAWERDPSTAAEGDLADRPFGPCDLYTWQSRRIRLFHDAGGVHGVVIANGDKLTWHNRHVREPMSVWRRSGAQEKKLKQPLVYLPNTHVPERAIWRGLAALLPSTAGRRQGPEGASALAPPVLHWIGHLRDEGIIGDDFAVRTRAIGMLYGAQQATITEVIDDAVSVSVALLRESNRELGAAAERAVEEADQGAQALGNLAANLAEAAGGDAAGPRERARQDAFSWLDRPFRTWLESLTGDSDPNEIRADWHRTARELLVELGRGMVAQAGPAAWIGRWVRGRHVGTVEADFWFRGRLNKIFSLAGEPEDTVASEEVPV